MQIFANIELLRVDIEEYLAQVVKTSKEYDEFSKVERLLKIIIGPHLEKPIEDKTVIEFFEKIIKIINKRMQFNLKKNGNKKKTN